MDKNKTLLIANLSVWPVIVATVLTIILYGCLRMAHRCCFGKSKRHYMVQLKDYGGANRDQERRFHNDEDEVEGKLTCDKTDQDAKDSNNIDSDVAGIGRFLAQYSSEDESQTDDVMTEDQQSESSRENTQYLPEMETTTEHIYPKSDSTADGYDGGGPNARKGRTTRPTPTPRLKRSSSGEQLTRDLSNASSEAISAQLADRFGNHDRDDVFPSMLAAGTKTLPPSVSGVSMFKDMKPSLGPPPLPTTLPNLARRGGKHAGNASWMEKAGVEERHGDAGEELMKKAYTNKKPTPPKTAPLMPLQKCPREKEPQTTFVRKNSMNSRPTAPPPSVPNIAGKSHFETGECILSGAEGEGAISQEGYINAYDEIWDDQLHDLDHYDCIEDHLYDCIDDMPRCRRSGHRPTLSRQKDVFRTEGLDDEFVNPFYARRLERSFKRKMRGREENPYASYIEEDKAAPGNERTRSEQKTSNSDQRTIPRGQHQVDAMAFKAEPFRMSMESGYLTAIESQPYNVHVSGYKRATSNEGSADNDQPDNESARVNPHDLSLTDPGTHYVNEYMNVDKAPTNLPIAAKGKEIKTEDGPYEELVTDPFIARSKPLKPSVPPKPKPDN